jgi:hypothetical protein
MCEPRLSILHEYVFSSICKVLVVCFVHQGGERMFILISDPDGGLLDRSLIWLMGWFWKENE